MPADLYARVAVALFIGAAAFALVVGRAPERWGAVVLLSGVVLVSQLQDRETWMDPQQRLLALDLLQTLALAWLMVRYRRRWLVAAVSIQLVSVASDVMRLIDITVRERAWITVYNVCGVAVAAMLLWGAVEALRARLDGGGDR